MAKAKDKESGFRLMGFGHRVYKNFDPRAKIIREMTHKVLGELGVDDPLLEVAMKLEEAALKDEYFIQRKLYPNVDFYSGIIYKALKIPTEMFTVMFAIGRTAGVAGLGGGKHVAASFQRVGQRLQPPRALARGQGRPRGVGGFGGLYRQQHVALAAIGDFGVDPARRGLEHRTPGAARERSAFDEVAEAFHAR